MMEVIHSLDEEERVGWLINMTANTTVDSESKVSLATLQLFFLDKSNGSVFETKLPYAPYFFVITKDGFEREVEVGLRSHFSDMIVSIEWVEKEDLEMPNHLSGKQRTLLKILFRNVNDLTTVKSRIVSAIKVNASTDKFITEFRDQEFDYSGNGRGYFESQTKSSYTEKIVELREYDVKYAMRCSIDMDVFVGSWYTVSAFHGTTTLRRAAIDHVSPPLRVLTFDIETTKAPLKFPQPSSDQVFMISVSLDGRGMLLVNRDVVASDIADFEYIPKISDSSRTIPVAVSNHKDEKSLLISFFDLVKNFSPHVVVTYNGDNFDFPFLQARAEANDLVLRDSIGFYQSTDGAFLHENGLASHLDCLYWVKRDSYLPQGSHGLKAVTRAKLGYNPVEVDPEEMVPLARGPQCQRMASYAVSDVVSTYDLFAKYIQPFVFSLCTIIPLRPDEVLRKGSGTLCESLLCIQAYRKNVVYPNKRLDEHEKFHKGQLIDTETYIGGHVEALEAGVYRYDLPLRFRCTSSAYQDILSDLDQCLRFALETEHDTKIDDVINFEKIKEEVSLALTSLRDKPERTEKPLILHLDVGAMYPNIILTNRLQPSSMVNDDICASCCFNREENQCKRPMEWIWKGDLFTASRGEYNQIRSQLERESFEVRHVEKAIEDMVANASKKKAAAAFSRGSSGSSSMWGTKPAIWERNAFKTTSRSSNNYNRFNRGGSRPNYAPGQKAERPTVNEEFRRLKSQAHAIKRTKRSGRNSDDSDGSDLTENDGNDSQNDEALSKPFHSLSDAVQVSMIKKRVTEYCKRAHRKLHESKEERKNSVVCQRENSFYVDTVRLFRDRRYVYKAETKKWKSKLSQALESSDSTNIKECQGRIIQFESLQLAHKCILNSFYGYVMRKGSRWYSMEMAGVVTYLGATLIQMARELVQQLGIPLELDTDGIWCCLPSSFPENLTFVTKTGKQIVVNYPCVLLNKEVNDRYTNSQYQDMVSPGAYAIRSECSIFFEVDGPHQAMILPASQVEGGCIKKRYAVFYPDGTLGELKGFEIKRRGELKMLKDFQDKVFYQFMLGSTLIESYSAAASVANKTLDVLFNKGVGVDDDEILDMLVESRNMSRRLCDYPADQKSLALTTARRIADFLGPQMVQDKGLTCSFVISRYPEGKPVTQRAIPISIFNASDDVRVLFLSKWVGGDRATDLRHFLDWEYYITRFSSCVQKIITIPAAMQGIKNPVPRVKHPDWLASKVREKYSPFVQNNSTAKFY